MSYMKDPREIYEELNPTFEPIRLQLACNMMHKYADQSRPKWLPISELSELDGVKLDDNVCLVKLTTYGATTKAMWGFFGELKVSQIQKFTHFTILPRITEDLY